MEDHDDLTPVFNQCTGKLDQQYGEAYPNNHDDDHDDGVGDYFIAELIEAQDESHRTIVADVSVTVHVKTSSSMKFSREYRE